MALSKEDKEALNDYYHNKDLYDPSKAPEQEVASFKPQELSEGGYAKGGYCAMCGGGCVGEHGYAEGGDVEDMFSVANSSAPVSAIAGSDPSDWEGSAGYAAPIVAKAPKPIASPSEDMPQGAFSGLGAPVPNAEAPASVEAPRPSPSGSSGLSPNEFNDLIKNMKNPSMGQRLGQGLSSGVAGFADAIMQGVAGAGPGQFQKNLEEEKQNRMQNLISSLKSKYENQFKGQELGLRGQEVGQQAKRIQEEGRHNVATEAETKEARRLESQQRDIENRRLEQEIKNQGSQRSQEQQKLEAEENQKTLEQAYKSSGPINSLERLLGFGPPKPNPDIVARAQGQAGPLGATTVKNGKTYKWSPISKQYHPVK